MVTVMRSRSRTQKHLLRVRAAKITHLYHAARYDLGIATEEEVAIDTLAERLGAEAVDSGGVIKPPDILGAWTRKR